MYIPTPAAFVGTGIVVFVVCMLLHMLFAAATLGGGAINDGNRRAYSVVNFVLNLGVWTGIILAIIGLFKFIFS